MKLVRAKPASGSSVWTYADAVVGGLDVAVLGVEDERDDLTDQRRGDRIDLLEDERLAQVGPVEVSVARLAAVVVVVDAELLRCLVRPALIVDDRGEAWAAVGCDEGAVRKQEATAAIEHVAEDQPAVRGQCIAGRRVEPIEVLLVDAGGSLAYVVDAGFAVSALRVHGALDAATRAVADAGAGAEITTGVDAVVLRVAQTIGWIADAGYAFP